MDFKLDGKPIKPTLPLTVNAVKEILDKLPNGALLTARSLMLRLNRNTEKNIRDFVGDKLPGYFAYGKGNTMYIGNKTTIKEYKKQACYE